MSPEHAFSPYKPRARFGTAVHETAVVLRHDGFVLAALALLLLWLPRVLEAWLAVPQVGAHATGAANWAGSLGELAVDIVLETVLAAFMTRIALDRLDGASASAEAVISAVLPALPLLLLIDAVTSWGELIRLFRYNEPPIAGHAGWAAIDLASLISDMLVVAVLGVSTPVVVAETRALVPALTRTTHLMRAGRWPVLWVFIAFALFILVGDFLVEAWLDPHHPGVFDQRPAGVVLTAFERLPTTLATVVMTVFAAAYYRALRAAQGEPASGEIADAFD